MKPLTKRQSDREPTQAYGLAGLPPWMAKMRAAAMDAIEESDVQEIVENQVKMAKTGDKDAIKFVFDVVLGGQNLKGATFIQHVYGHEDPAKPVKALGGSNGKLRAMQARAAAGLPLHDPGDGCGD